ncbi:microtubule-associated protein 10-like [Trichogramma pretiosum]|uniref:microtubule-associated protein 10-like n=1 Tax=Trichogramma pretiosum TaxID=7493 RepID=UPI000C71C6C7|nr:microtubule-associated protein 10-like [Trichogramma pretiosum]
MEKNAQELFLAEFMVDRVKIPSVQAQVGNDETSTQPKTCIEFKILSLPPIFICQEPTSGSNCTCLGDEPLVFRKGKSCLFALPSHLLAKPVCSFPVLMTAYKIFPPDTLPDVMTLGQCQIDVRDIVNDLMQESACKAERTSPCKAMKNNFRIQTPTGQCVGEVCAFVRMSRLGKKVVTQFQTPHNKKPYLFKGRDRSSVFQCRKVEENADDCCPKPKCPMEKPSKSCGGGGGQKSQKSCGKKKSSCGQSAETDHCGSNFNAEEKTRKCGCKIKDGKGCGGC